MREPIRWQNAWWHQRPDGSWLRFNDQTQAWEAMPLQPGYVASPGIGVGAKIAIAAGISLVVLLIVAILAAIAIPVFLRQREKAWIAQVENALRRASAAQETYSFDEGTYATSIGDLELNGLDYSDDVNLRLARASATAYCIEATHDSLPGEVWSYDNRFSRIRERPCD